MVRWGVRVAAVLIVVGVVAGYVMAGQGRNLSWEHEFVDGWSPGSGYRPPTAWVALWQGCIRFGYLPQPSYAFGFSIDLPFIPPDPLFVWTPEVYVSSTGEDSVSVRVPLWMLLVPAALVGGWMVRDARHWWVARREGMCVGCGYSLEGLRDGARCPECGAETSASTTRAFGA